MIVTHGGKGFVQLEQEAIWNEECDKFDHGQEFKTFTLPELLENRDKGGMPEGRVKFWNKKTRKFVSSKDEL